MKTQIVTTRVKPSHTYVKEVQMIPIAYSDYSFGQSGGQSGSKIGLLLFVLCIAAAVFFFWKLKSPSESAKAAQLEIKRLEAEAREREAQKQALKQQIQAKLSLTVRKFDDIEQEQQAIDSEFLTLFEVPLEQAHLTMTRKTARRILLSSTFSATYAQLLNTRVPVASFTKQRDTITQVAGNVSADWIADSNIALLDEVLIWIDGKHSVLQQQRNILDQLSKLSL